MRKDQIFEKVAAELHQYFSPNAPVKHDQKIIGRSGVLRQIDVLIEDEIATYPLRIVIDCKYYSSKVDINDVGQVWDLVDDVRANLGVIISNAGFTSGAKKRALELGRMKLCSILDLENKDFSVKLALPMICELRKPVFNFKVAGTDSNMNLHVDEKLWQIENKIDGNVLNVYQDFLSKWNSDEISHEVGSHILAYSPSDWRLIGPNGSFEFNILEVNYNSVPRYYVGFVPLIEGKGIIDIQENVLKTRGFTTDKVVFEDIQKNWEVFDNLNDIKIKPVFHFVASDMFLS